MKKILFLLCFTLFTIHLHAQGGEIDYSFSIPPAGVNKNVNSIAVQPDNKVLIVGAFESYGTISVGRIVRTQPNGQVDQTFNTGSGADNVIEISVLQPDGKILVGGIFSTFNEVNSPCIVRLNQDGSVDPDFNSRMGTDLSIVRTIAVQPDGKILIGGIFTTYDGIPRNNIARLNPDGSLDSSFDPGNGANDYVGDVKLLSDNKILLSGMFTEYNGNTQNRIARLNPDGSLDPSFDIGNGANGFISTLAILPDNKIFIGGDFTSYNDLPLNRIARLNPDGTVDHSFFAGMGADNFVLSINIQEDQKVIITGAFEHINGIEKKHIARLNNDGSLDLLFNTGSGANGRIAASAIQQDGKILIGGHFSSYNDVTRNRITRLYGGCAPTASIQNINICQGQSFIFNNHTYTETGNYLDTLQTALGCDSFVITVLSILQSSTTHEVQVILCEGESHTVGTHTYNSTGKYTDTLQAQQGCDSIVVTNLVILPKTQTNIRTICEGNYYTVGLNQYTNTGTYEDTLYIELTPERTCQIIITSHLSVTPAPMFSNPQTICAGSSYSINHKMYTTAGTYYDTLRTIAGCDSIIVTELSISEPLELSVSQNNYELSVEEIPGATYQWINCEQSFTPIESETSSVFVAQNDGSYAVTVDNEGCSYTSACYQIVSTHLNDTWEKNSFTLYPNPATETLHLILPEASSIQKIKIMNMTGQLMLSTTTLPISVNMLPKGLYILAVETPQGIWHEQFVKE
jgi:uncharacterized delta-60 repeat protein